MTTTQARTREKDAASILKGVARATENRPFAEKMYSRASDVVSAPGFVSGPGRSGGVGVTDRPRDGRKVERDQRRVHQKKSVVTEY